MSEGPSRAAHEEFGLPALEAMASGVPVVSSNRASLPEVAGDAAVMVDPEDAGSIAEAMHVLIADRDRWNGYAARGIARPAGFTWERTAKETVKAYRAAAGD